MRAPTVCLRVPVSPRPPRPLCPRAVCLHFLPPFTSAALIETGDRVPISPPSPAWLLAPQVSLHRHFSAALCALAASPASSAHAQSCPILCDPMDCSPLGSSVHGTLQERTLQCAAISSSRGSSWLRNQTLISCVSCTGRWILHQLGHQGNLSPPLDYLITS